MLKKYIFMALLSSSFAVNASELSITDATACQRLGIQISEQDSEIKKLAESLKLEAKKLDEEYSLLEKEKEIAANNISKIRELNAKIEDYNRRSKELDVRYSIFDISKQASNVKRFNENCGVKSISPVTVVAVCKHPISELDIFCNSITKQMGLTRHEH